MQSADEYIVKTESAVRKLLDGIDTYLQVLRDSPAPVFITSTPIGPAFDAQFEVWLLKNKAKNDAAAEARRQFMAESFALDTLCGALLQVGQKALERYSANEAVIPSLAAVVKPSQARYCVGRLVRGVPLGLVVYAGRNQHAHFNEGALREPSATVFERLATAHEHAAATASRDPAFDLQRPGVTSYAANVTALLGWRDYEAYCADLRAMLGL
jgi:hypothetical protein